jgi:putative two-component system response regulator
VPANPATVLVVDDEPLVCQAIQRKLASSGFACAVATEPQQAKHLLALQQFDVMVADIHMPGISGLELLDHARQVAPACRVILISGSPTTEDIARAITRGAYDYIQKPFNMSDLICSVVRAAGDDSAASVLPTKAAQAFQVQDRAKQTALDVIRALVCTVEAKDPYTRRHSEQVAHYTTHLARQLDLTDEQVETLYAAALLHDIGKIGIPDNVLTKPGALTDEEFQNIRRHPVLGETIVANMACFAQEARIIRHHHENWDGSGYPDGLKAEECPIGSRIIRVADSVDAMLMHRTYKKGYPVEKMLDELARCAARQFDPRIASITIEWCQTNPGVLILPSGSSAVFT